IPSKQYNHINFNYTGSAFSPFSPLKPALIGSEQLSDKALLSSYTPSLVKIEFPNIINIKQTYPFVKIMKAELEIRVNTSLNAYPYNIPAQLAMYISNQNNELSSVLTSDLTGYAQTGDLVSDPLVADGTKYSFDITSYITAVLS